MNSNDWKLPLNIAVGLHILVLLGTLYLPGIFKSKPKFADIYTVSLINIAEPSSSPAAAVKEQMAAPPQPSAPPVKVQKIAPVKKAVALDQPKEKAAPVKAAPVPQNPISLKPLKKKIVEKVKPQVKDPRSREQERNKRQQLAEALREEALLAEKAKLAQEALDAERRLFQSQQLAEARQTTRTSASDNHTSTTARTGNSSSSLLESQYLASIVNRLHQFWTPPEYLQQDPDLTAVVVITIDLDGTITDMLFENKSGDRVFDQFVSKTIEAANPMPPIPPAMKKQRFEIGLRFKPGSIQ